MITITLSNQKGGVSKTTTSFALASGLTHRGYRVLAVDLDPQTNLSFSSGVNLLGVAATLYDVFKGDTTIGEAIIKTDIGFDLLPGGLDLASADMDFTQIGREEMLKDALEEVEQYYDYCIIDTPPMLGILTINALTASRYQIIPMNADAYSIQGISHMSKMINVIQKKRNRDLEVLGILLTKYNDRQNVSRTVSEYITNAADQLKTRVFKTRIRESVAVKDVCLHQGDLFTEIPNANATMDYNSFIDEILEVMNNGKKED